MTTTTKERQMQHLVTQTPKGRHAYSHVTVAMVVEADSAAAAVRRARDATGEAEKWFVPDPHYSAPRAVPLVHNSVYTF